MEKKFDILNAEGSVLGLYINDNQDYYFNSIIKDGSGTIFYQVTLALILKYFYSKYNLKQIIENSPDFIVRHKYRNQEESFLKEDLINQVQSVNSLYCDKPHSMKNPEFELWIQKISID